MRIVVLHDDADGAATISYPPANKRGFSPTVPAWASIFIPLLMGIVTLVIGELYYSAYQHHNITDALAVILYFLLDLAQAVGANMLLTEATKVAVGRYRPDFLARCEPENPGPDFLLQYGNNTVGNPAYDCLGDNSEDTIEDGRKSFPSGHASFSFTISTYAAGYMIWCWNLRRNWTPRSRGPLKEFLSDLGNVCAKLWTLIMLGVAWCDCLPCFHLIYACKELKLYTRFCIISRTRTPMRLTVVLFAFAGASHVLASQTINTMSVMWLRGWSLE